MIIGSRRTRGLNALLRRGFDASVDPLDRALTLWTLRHVNDELTVEVVLDLLDSTKPDVVRSGARAAALFRGGKLFALALTALCERTPDTVDDITALLLDFGQDICPEAHKLLKSSLGAGAHEDPRWQAVLVSLLAYHRYRPAASTLSRLLWNCEDEEVRTRLVKAIAALSRTRLGAVVM